MSEVNTTEITRFIESELEKFDVTTETLKAMVEPVKGLTIAGIDDRDDYIKVRESRLMLKNKRVEIEKNGKALRENAVKFQRAVIAREKELIDIIEPEELRLKNEETKYEQLKEQQRIENERKEAERIQSRINQLAKFNYAIDFYEAKIMPDEEFDALLSNAQEEYNAELQRIEAEKAAQERLRQEEAERIRLEREELDRIRAEQAKREAELKAERERIANEQAEREASIRAEQEKIRKAQEAREAELRAEQAKLEAEKRRIELEEAKQKAAEQARIESEERAKREEQVRIERENQARIEAQRQEALKPFKVKMLDFAERLQNLCLETPTSSQDAGAKLHNDVNDMLTKLSEHIKTRVKSL